MFERVYGYDLLDTIHNFYPELMYDNVAFPEQTLEWMRYRTSQLFPEQYTHNTNNYRLFQSQSRQTELTNWRQRGNTQLASQTEITTPVQPTIRTIIIPNMRQQATQQQPQQEPQGTQEPQVRIRISNYEDIVQQLFQPNANSVVDILNLFSNVNLAQTDAPTEEQIEAGTTIVSYSEIPIDTTCAICQEDADRPWRRLQCAHYFHQSCVDPWFERDAHCPVCRADIRQLS